MEVLSPRRRFPDTPSLLVLRLADVVSRTGVVCLGGEVFVIGGTMGGVAHINT